jgi:hypothetical protein
MNGMGIERWLGVAAGLAVGVAVLYYLYGPGLPDLTRGPDEAPVAEAPPAPAPEPPQPAEPPAEQAPRYPVPAVGQPAARPPAATVAPTGDLAASDADVRSAAAEVFGAAPIESFLVPDRVIQNFVATVDSLDRDPVPLRFRVVQHVPEVPVVEKDGDRLWLSSDNDERYRLLAGALRETSAQSIARLYLRYYPLLQRAYREMGYPGAHFNDRVVQVIDHLLAAPEVEHPIELVQPKVLYRFADPELEELSSGQKLMVRIGPANATIAKTRLREVRAIITAGAAPGAKR